MRPKLHLPVLGRAFRVTGMISGILAEFAISKAATVLCHIDLHLSREARYKPVDTSEVAKLRVPAWSVSSRAVHWQVSTGTQARETPTRSPGGHHPGHTRAMAGRGPPM
jgi:hypothetical protein